MGKAHAGLQRERSIRPIIAAEYHARHRECENANLARRQCEKLRRST
jgi:hypothetical protein